MLEALYLASLTGLPSSSTKPAGCHQLCLVLWGFAKAESCIGLHCKAVGMPCLSWFSLPKNTIMLYMNIYIYDMSLYKILQYILYILRYRSDILSLLIDRSERQEAFVQWFKVDSSLPRGTWNLPVFAALPWRSSHVDVVTMCGDPRKTPLFAAHYAFRELQPSFTWHRSLEQCGSMDPCGSCTDVDHWRHLQHPLETSLWLVNPKQSWFFKGLAMEPPCFFTLRHTRVPWIMSQGQILDIIPDRFLGPSAWVRWCSRAAMAVPAALRCWGQSGIWSRTHMNTYHPSGFEANFLRGVLRFAALSVLSLAKRIAHLSLQTLLIMTMTDERQSPRSNSTDQTLYRSY